MSIGKGYSEIATSQAFIFLFDYIILYGKHNMKTCAALEFSIRLQINFLLVLTFAFLTMQGIPSIPRGATSEKDESA